MLQETMFQIQVLKPCKSIQESSEELKSCFRLRLDSFSIDKVFVEVYENQFSRSDFTPIREYMFRLSFLTTLNIYKNHFKGRHKLH